MTTSATIPTAPGAVPLLGHLPRLARDPLRYLDSLPAHGDLVTLRLGRKNVLLVCDPAVAAWRDGQELEVVTEMMKVTGRVLTATMFSSSVPEATLREIMADSLELTRGLLVDTALPAPLARLTPGYSRYRKAVARLRKTTLTLVTERRAEGDAATEHGDLLSALLTKAEDGSDEFSDTEIVDQLSFMLVAGTETTAQTVSWALYQLSKRPEDETALHAEVDEVLAGRPASYDDIPRLELTNRILSEALRFYSPSWLFTRVTTADTELRGHPIPAGTDVFYSPYIIDRTARAHVEPRRFDPDRWRPERAAGAPREGYIPFGTGARKCIGDQFSLVESALILAAIASRWRFKAIPGNRIRTSRKIVVTPRGLRLRAVARAR